MAEYAQIVDVAAPDQAIAGAQVGVSVTIKNLASVPVGIMVVAALEYGVTPWPDVIFPSDWANVDPGETGEFSGYFYMPDRAVTIHAYSYYYGDDGGWHFDDEKTKSVAAAVAAAQISGFTIADFKKV